MIYQKIFILILNYSYNIVLSIVSFQEKRYTRNDTIPYSTLIYESLSRGSSSFSSTISSDAGSILNFASLLNEDFDETKEPLVSTKEFVYSVSENMSSSIKDISSISENFVFLKENMEFCEAESFFSQQYMSYHPIEYSYSFNKNNFDKKKSIKSLFFSIFSKLTIKK